ncbi:GNAT family N-acetyltransferase [Nocardiopsis terrae]
MNETQVHPESNQRRSFNTILQGELVSLAWPGEHDYATIERWLTPTSHAAVLTGDTSEVVTVDTIRKTNTSGRARFYMIVTNAGEAVGVVNHRQVGGIGNYAIGVAVGPDELWDKGYGFEGSALVVEHLFQNLNANRVQFQVAMFNKRMISMVTRGGFILDGVLRDYYFLDGEYHDATIWSILRKEFYEQIEKEGDQSMPPVINLVPERDKRTARTLFQKYLESLPKTSLSEFPERGRTSL